MNRLNLFHVAYGFSLILFSVSLYGQTNEGIWQDNPNIDQIPPGYFNSVNYEFSPEAVITIDGWDNFDLGVDYAEPHMSVNPLNPLQYLNAWNINNTHYTQNGFDWSTLAPSFGVSPAGDPVTAYDSLGNLFYETMYGSISGCKVIRSTNNGQTWSAGVTSIAGNDKNWIACDQTSGPYANYVYTTMTPGNFARSTDHGATFQTTATLASQSLPGMMVCVGPDNTTGTSGGCVYVVTHSGTNGAGTYTFYRSTNGGTSFVQRSAQQFSNYIGTEISGRSTVNGMRTRPYPMIACDNSFGPHRGRLYLVYASNQPAGSGNKPNIFLRYSDDQAATWSGAVVVNDDPNTAANHNFFPAIWCDKQTGRLYIKWYDSRLCPTSDSMDVYATYTDDGGASFAPNQRITNKTFKTKLSGSGGAPAYQGDYDAVSGINNQALLVWTDFRNDNYGSYVAYFPDFAMLTSVSNLTLRADSDSALFNVKVPAVKLYTGTAAFTTEIIPTPSAGQILVTPVGSNVLSSYPDSVIFKVKTLGPVTAGSYTLVVTGKGPNGTPVHKRTIQLTIENNDLAAYYPFNGNAHDESGNGNHAVTITGPTLTTDRFGKPDSAYYFPGIGDNNIIINNSPSLQLNTGSFCIWFNYLGYQYNPRFFSKHTAYQSFIHNENNLTGPISFNSGPFGLETNNAPPDSQWHFLAVVKDNDSLKMYLDGNRIASASYSGSFTQDTSRLFIGNLGFGTNRDAQFKGKLDDFRIYNRALTELEIQNLYRIGQIAPVLSWTSEPGFETDGVSPDSGTTNTVFNFRVKYSDANGDAPLSGFPKLHVKKAGVEIANSPFTLTAVTDQVKNSSGDSKSMLDSSFFTGKIYTTGISSLSLGSDYTYYFEAYDSFNNAASGAAAQEKSGPLIYNPNLITVPVFCEQFESGLNGWTITNEGGTSGCIWQIRTVPFPNAYTLPAASSGGIMSADVDECGSGSTMNSNAVLNQVLDCSQFTGVKIEFDNDWNVIDAQDEAHVDVSTDGGATWTGVWDKVGADIRNTHELVDITSLAAGKSAVKVRLRSVQPGWDWWWVLDNLCIYGQYDQSKFQLAVDISNGWNMVSIPGILPDNQGVANWWPGKDPSAGVFRFANGYQAVDEAAPGIGYWMKHIGAQTYNTGEEWPSEGITKVPHDSINAMQGWNLFGGYEQSVSASALSTFPEGLIISQVYKYGSGYQVAGTIDPGYGYWVKLSGPGYIKIPSGTSKVLAGLSAEQFGRITITDATQKSYTLYAVNGETDLSAGVDLTQFDLPPYPPQGMFDVRYSSQRYADDISTPQSIEMTGVQYPVKIKAEECGIIISDETGKEIARLKAGEEVSVTASGKLVVSANVIPLVYSLEQNYPNPFNPGTTIQFSISEDVQNVKLIVYSALGEKVAELVNTGLQAGIYKYPWNAGTFASGIYIYQLVTEKFVSSKKMILLK